MKMINEEYKQVCPNCSMSFSKFPLAFPTEVEIEEHLETCGQYEEREMSEQELIIRAHFGLI